MKPIIVETLENIKNDEIIDNTFDNNNIIKKNKDNNVVVEDISSPFLKPNINNNNNNNNNPITSPTATVCGVTLCDNPPNTTSKYCLVSSPKKLVCIPSTTTTTTTTTSSASTFLAEDDQTCICKFELNVPLIISAPITCGIDRYPIYTGAKCADLSLCSIELYISPGKGTIILNGTGNIAAPSIDIFADGLTLEKSNTINASFLGYPPMRDYAEPCKPKGQPTTTTYYGYGASHAGTGGIGGSNVVTACDTYNTYLTQPQVNNTIIGNAIKPDPDLKLSMENFGSSGGCKYIYIYILKLLFTHTINLYTYIIICKHTHTHTHTYNLTPTSYYYVIMYRFWFHLWW